MQETHSIPIQLLTTEQLETYCAQCNTLDSPFYDFELIAAIQTELKQRKATEQLTVKTTQKPFRWDIVTYTLMVITAVICGLQLRSIFHSIKCPSLPIAEELTHE